MLTLQQVQESYPGRVILTFERGGRTLHGLEPEAASLRWYVAAFMSRGRDKVVESLLAAVFPGELGRELSAMEAEQPAARLDLIQEVLQAVGLDPAYEKVFDAEGFPLTRTVRDAESGEVIVWRAPTVPETRRLTQGGGNKADEIKLLLLQIAADRRALLAYLEARPMRLIGLFGHIFGEEGLGRGFTTARRAPEPTPPPPAPEPPAEPTGAG